MKKHISLLVLLLLSMLTVLAAAETPVLKAPHGVLMEASTGNVVYENNAKERVYPASTTKVLTVLLAIEKAEADAAAAGITLEEQLQTVLTVSAEARDVPFDSSVMGLLVGETVTLYDCIMGTMLISGNESANVLAEYVSGSLAAFVELMNSRAAELGATDTHFVNANGYFDEYHYTTPTDMVKIMGAALEKEFFRQVIGTKEHTLSASNINAARTIHNTNKLLSNSSEYGFSMAIGGKTGYTDVAKNCLVAAAELNGVTMISAVFEASVIDGKTVSYTDTIELFRYGFDNYERIDIQQKDELMAECPIKRAKGGAKAVKLLTAESASLVVPKGTVLSEVLKNEVTLNQESLKAPVTAGATLGTLNIYYTGDFYPNDVPVATIALVADKDYAFSVWSVIRDVVLTILGIAVAFVVIVLIAGNIKMHNARRRRNRNRSNYRRR